MCKKHQLLLAMEAEKSVYLHSFLYSICDEIVYEQLLFTLAKWTWRWHYWKTATRWDTQTHTHTHTEGWAIYSLSCTGLKQIVLRMPVRLGSGVHLSGLDRTLLPESHPSSEGVLGKATSWGKVGLDIKTAQWLWLQITVRGKKYFDINWSI